MKRRGGIKMVQKDLERFWNKVQILPFVSCWEWTGGKHKNGYGGFSFKGESVKAHRFAYHLINSNFPIKNLNHKNDLDHLCRNKLCVNPSHLEPVTNRENVIRGKAGKLKKNKTSKYTGVCWNKRKKKWEATIWKDGKTKFLGYFNGEQIAAQAYQDAANALK
jgi:hypothetical protein